MSQTFNQGYLLDLHYPSWWGQVHPSWYPIAITWPLLCPLMDLKGPKLRSRPSKSLGSWGTPLRPELEVRGGHVDQKLPLIGGPSTYFWTFTRVRLVTWRTSRPLFRGLTSPQLGHYQLYTCSPREQGWYPILWEVWPWPYNCSPHEGKIINRLPVTTNFHSTGTLIAKHPPSWVHFTIRLTNLTLTPSD
jgi:hypothetical protein